MNRSEDMYMGGGWWGARIEVEVGEEERVLFWIGEVNKVLMTMIVSWVRSTRRVGV